MMKAHGLVMLIVWGVLGVIGGVVGCDPIRPGCGGKNMTLDLGYGVSMKLVEIPAGKFLMGSPADETNRQDDEGLAPGKWVNGSPQIEMPIYKPFYMGITHVTVDQFAAFVKDTGYKTDAEKDGTSSGFMVHNGKFEVKEIDGCSWRKPSFEQNGDHPVVQVSWHDAQAFCVWLSKKTGKTVVLPTEAQWEYACRGATTTAYPWGDNPDDGKGWANVFDQSLKQKAFPSDHTKKGSFSYNDGFVFTSPVGSFRPNAFGLFDMNGNARQWCEDHYGEYGKGSATNPKGAGSGDIKVLRGGDWFANPRECRSARRSWGVAYNRLDNVGFRVVVDAAGEK